MIDHGTEAHLLADILAAKDIPVIIGPLFTSRSKVELRNRSLANPGKLAAAGVTIAITTDHPVVPINFLAHQAALSVKHGLDRDTALRALTINPARIVGIDDRLGSIEPGKDADLVIWSGDPLDVLSRVDPRADRRRGDLPLRGRRGDVRRPLTGRCEAHAAARRVRARRPAPVADCRPRHDSGSASTAAADGPRPGCGPADHRCASNAIWRLRVPTLVITALTSSTSPAITGARNCTSEYEANRPSSPSVRMHTSVATSPNRPSMYAPSTRLPP